MGTQTSKLGRLVGGISNLKGIAACSVEDHEELLLALRKEGLRFESLIRQNLLETRTDYGKKYQTRAIWILTAALTKIPGDEGKQALLAWSSAEDRTQYEGHIVLNDLKTPTSIMYQPRYGTFDEKDSSSTFSGEKVKLGRVPSGVEASLVSQKGYELGFKAATEVMRDGILNDIISLSSNRYMAASPQTGTRVSVWHNERWYDDGIVTKVSLLKNENGGACRVALYSNQIISAATQLATIKIKYNRGRSQKILSTQQLVDRRLVKYHEAEWVGYGHPFLGKQINYANGVNAQVVAWSVATPEVVFRLKVTKGKEMKTRADGSVDSPGYLILEERELNAFLYEDERLRALQGLQAYARTELSKKRARKAVHDVRILQLASRVFLLHTQTLHTALLTKQTKASMCLAAAINAVLQVRERIQFSEAIKVLQVISPVYRAVQTRIKNKKAFVKISFLEQEILDTEKGYVQSLEALQNAYLVPLRKQFGDKVATIISSNLQAILSLHKTLLMELEAFFAKEKKKCLPFSLNGSGLLLQRYTPYFKLYTQYLVGYNAAVDEVKRLKATSRSFSKFLTNQRTKTNYGKLQEITSYLIMPCQRIPRYRMLLESIIKKYPKPAPTAEGDAYQKSLGSALEKVKESATHNNNMQRAMETLDDIKRIHAMITGPCPQLVAPHRSFIQEGTADVKTIGDYGEITNKALIYLFSDLFLWTSVGHEFRGCIHLVTSKLKPYIAEKDSNIHAFHLQASEAGAKGRKLAVIVMLASARKVNDWEEKMKEQTQKAKELEAKMVKSARPKRVSFTTEKV
ncbi:hypothetical protein AAMO2058_000784400 [Amorphochlora amoebiformis]